MKLRELRLYIEQVHYEGSFSLDVEGHVMVYLNSARWKWVWIELMVRVPAFVGVGMHNA